jgi:hypothetical protein
VPVPDLLDQPTTLDAMQAVAGAMSAASVFLDTEWALALQVGTTIVPMEWPLCDVSKVCLTGSRPSGRIVVVPSSEPPMDHAGHAAPLPVRAEGHCSTLSIGSAVLSPTAVMERTLLSPRGLFDSIVDIDSLVGLESGLDSRNSRGVVVSLPHSGRYKLRFFFLHNHAFCETCF